MTSAEGLSDPPRPARATARHWLVLAGAAALMIGAMFVFLSHSLVNPPLARALGVGLSQVMFYNSIVSLAGAVAMTTVGPWAMLTLGPRRTAMIGGGLSALALLAISFTTSLLMLYLISVILGLAFTISTSMAASVLIGNWFETSRGTIFGAMFALAGIGGVSMGFVMPPVVEAGGFQAGFRLLAGLIAVLTIGSGAFLIRSHPADVGLLPRGAVPRRVLQESAPTSVQIPGVPRAKAVRSPQFAALLVAIMLVTAVHAVQQHFAPLLTDRGVSLAAAGSLLSLLALAGVFGTLGVGALNDRAGTRTAVVFALGCQLASMGVFLAASGYLPLAAGITIFALGSSLPMVLVPILVMVLFGPRDYAAILGPTMAALPVGIAVGTPLWGLAVDATGSYDVGLVTAMVATVVAAALLVWAIRTAPAFRDRVARDLDRDPGGAPSD